MIDNTIFELCEENLLKGSAEEMIDVIYDTLMENVNYPQFNFDEVEEQECDRKNNAITFMYKGHSYKISIELIEESINCDNCVYYV